MLPPALLPPFLASYRGRLLAAFSTFRFCASGGASGSESLVFRVIRVIRVPVFCFWLCFWKRFPRYPRYPLPVFCFWSCFWKRFVRFPRYPRSGALRSVIVVVRVLLAYGDNVRSGGGSGGPKMALL